VEVAGELQVVGRIGEHQIDRLGRQLLELVKTVADQNPVDERLRVRPGIEAHDPPCPLALTSG
jgi:hypothetical protein